jgi:pyruvate/2-oxoglutarate dehydrogenase complex dihydrolipoamide dehydrogenase (E3) component
VPFIDGLRGLRHLTNENLFEPDALPGWLAVLGGGAMGAEMSQAFARLGSKVTSSRPRTGSSPRRNQRHSEAVTAAFVEDGISVRVGGKVAKVEAIGSEGAAVVHVEDGEPVETDRVPVAIGRRPATSSLGLEDIGMALDDRGFARNDDSLATSVPGIWAVGDVAGKLQFTHAANQMAFIAVRNALSPWVRVRHEAALAMRTKMFTDRLAQTVHTYPTWSMAVQKAAAQFFSTVEGREARSARA